jgi:hypothetical protein
MGWQLAKAHIITADEFDKIYQEVLHDLHEALMNGNFQTFSNTPAPQITEEDVEKMKKWFDKQEKKKKHQTGGLILPPPTPPAPISTSLPNPPKGITFNAISGSLVSGGHGSWSSLLFLDDMVFTPNMVSAEFFRNVNPNELARLLFASGLQEVELVDATYVREHYLRQFYVEHYERALPWSEVVDFADTYLKVAYGSPLTTKLVSSFNAMTMQRKDYFMPALKVMHMDETGKLWSPVYPVSWPDDHMVGRHVVLESANVFDNLEHYHMDFHTCQEYHGLSNTPREDCDCGIYGGVNLEELQEYFWAPPGGGRLFNMDKKFSQSTRRLCIIEPDQDSFIYPARKGWKADSAFISEIVGDTMSVKDASELLSIVWNRRLDVSRVMENPNAYR